MSSPSFITVRDKQVRVRVAGSPDSAPVVLIHGITRSLEDWSEQFVRLAHGHRLIALDLPGCGFSERASTETSLTTLAESVLDVLDALGETRRVHLIGNSLGGAVAMRVATLAPTRTAGLVLADSAGFGKEVALPLRLMSIPGLGEAMTFHTTRGAAYVLERMSLADPRLATSARVDHAIAISRQPDTGRVSLEIARALGTPRGIKDSWRKELLAEVASLRIPTLLMWGDQDRVLPATHLAEAERVFPHAEAVLFRGIGHMPQIEVPDEFADRVTHFIGTTAQIHPAPGVSC